MTYRPAVKMWQSGVACHAV